MRGSKRWVAVIALIASGALVAGWVVAVHSRPDARTLLDLLPPDADAYVVLDLEALQSNPVVKKLLADPPDITSTEEYQRLLRDSGFHYQDDLKQLAAAKLGEDWAGAAVVNVDRERLVSYLESQGAVKSQQGAQTVYAFGSVRPFRLTFLDDQLVAFTIGADPALLAGMWNRQSNSGSGSATEDLRREGHTESAPSEAGLWIFARMDRLLHAHPEGAQIGPFQFGQEWMAGSRTAVAYVNSSALHLELHAEDRCDTAASAGRIASAFQTVLAVLRAVPSKQESSGGSDYTPLLATLTMHQAGASVLLDWHLTPGMLMTLLENQK